MMIKDYNDIAKGYNELYGEEQIAKARQILKHIEIKPEFRLLDVGCGTGISTKLFKCHTTGIDPSFDLLKQNDLPAVQGVAESLPFKDSSFDIVISLTAIQNFFDIEKALLEINRVAKDIMIISVLKGVGNYQKIHDAIKKNLSIEHYVNEVKDTIYFCRKKI